MDTLLEVRGLKTHFTTDRGLFRAVDGIEFSVPGADRRPGRQIGLRQERDVAVDHGPGAEPPGRSRPRRCCSTARRARPFADERRRLRGGKISMIFQEPMTSLNPVHTVGEQIAEAILRAQARCRRVPRRACDRDARAGAHPRRAQRVDDYPHQLSGGMRQRVMIAMALSCEPALLIADEPTTALDVTIQAQILDLLSDLQQRLGMAILIITHDLGVIAEVADQVLVMYAGRIVESAPVNDLFVDPQHPYTIGLLGSIPRIDVDRERLATIEGMVPSPNNQPRRLPLRAALPVRGPALPAGAAAVARYGAGHQVACWKAPVEVTS